MKASGAMLDSPFCHVYRFRDGKAVPCEPPRCKIAGATRHHRRSPTRPNPASSSRNPMTKRTLASSLLFVFALAPLGAQPDPGKEELKLKLPKPMFIGTPTNIKSANLEADHRQAARRRSTCPKGTVLLSAEEAGDVERHAAGHRRARHGHRRREVRRRRLLHRARARARSGCRSISARRTRSPPSSRGTTTARRASTATSIVQVSDDPAFKTRRDDGLQQRPRQLVEARRRARTRSTSRSPRASCSTRRARRAGTSGSTRTGTRRTT